LNLISLSVCKFATVKANNSNETFKPYLTRLVKLKQIIQKHTSFI